MLQIEGLSFAYGSRQILTDLNLLVSEGSVVGLIGPNGSGKTTTLRLAADLLPIRQGRVLVNGVDISREPLRAKSQLAFIPDSPYGFEHLTVQEYLNMYRLLQEGDSSYSERSQYHLVAMDMEHLVHDSLGSLSAGTRRKVAIAAAFSLAPPVLLFDEATSALDPETILVVEVALRRLAGHKRGLLIATQDLDFAERMCDLVYLLQDGRVIESGSPKALLSNYGVKSMREVFLELVGFSENLKKFDESFSRSL